MAYINISLTFILILKSSNGCFKKKEKGTSYFILFRKITVYRKSDK